MARDEQSWTQLPRDAADALAALVQSSDDAIYSKDRNAVLTTWNQAAERVYGYTAEEAIGKPISMLVPPSRAGEEIDILERILRGERVQHYETERMRKDGKIVQVSVSVSPVHNSEGEIVEAAVIARDIGEKKRMEAQVAALKRKQAFALNDAVVQGLATSKMSLEMGDHERGLRAVATTLERAKTIVSDLMTGAGDVEPGDLVRDEPARMED